MLIRHIVLNIKKSLIKARKPIYRADSSPLYSANYLITDSEEQYQSRCKVDQWEIPMLEVVIG
jgi:hypothetical protein